MLRGIDAPSQPSIQIMNHQGAIDHILFRLSTQLAKHLFYHGLHHTLDVLEAAERIGKEEQLTTHEMKLVLVAAAYHDCGFLDTYAEHELAGCEIARKVLPDFAFTPEDIDIICTMIMATKVPQDPKSELANILCDADLDYLGRDDFYTIGDTLLEELKFKGILQDEQSWNRLQVKFLTAHRFHTSYAKAHREGVKQAHLLQVQKLVAS